MDDYTYERKVEPVAPRADDPLFPPVIMKLIRPFLTAVERVTINDQWSINDIFSLHPTQFELILKDACYIGNVYAVSILLNYTGGHKGIPHRLHHFYHAGGICRHSMDRRNKITLQQKRLIWEMFLVKLAPYDIPNPIELALYIADQGTPEEFFDFIYAIKNQKIGKYSLISTVGHMINFSTRPDLLYQFIVRGFMTEELILLIWKTKYGSHIIFNPQDNHSIYPTNVAMVKWDDISLLNSVKHMIPHGYKLFDCEKLIHNWIKKDDQDSLIKFMTEIVEDDSDKAINVRQFPDYCTTMSSYGYLLYFCVLYDKLDMLMPHFPTIQLIMSCSFFRKVYHKNTDNSFVKYADGSIEYSYRNTKIMRTVNKLVTRKMKKRPIVVRMTTEGDPMYCQTLALYIQHGMGHEFFKWDRLKFHSKS